VPLGSPRRGGIAADTDSGPRGIKSDGCIASAAAPLTRLELRVLHSARVSASRDLQQPDDQVRAAARGEQDAFRRAFEPYRSELRAHCYRLVGCAHDSEDAVQEALLRAWRGLSSFDQTRALRPWLYKIATNVCLDMLSRRDRRILPFDLAARDSDETAHLQPWHSVTPYPDEHLPEGGGYASPEARYEQREAVELAFVAALQHLPARQRAILVLRDVLGFSAPEIAEQVGTSTASINSALQRARQTLEHRLPERSQVRTLQSLGDERVRKLARRFADAMETGDVEGVIRLLAPEASFAMPPHAHSSQGREAVAKSWLMPPPHQRVLRLIPVRANGQLAFAAYRLYPGASSYVPLCLDIVSITETGIQSVVAFRDIDHFALFDLPARLPLSAGWQGSRSASADRADEFSLQEE
jgi:RNA polymerase sigma-70 factor, ECF subfamily